MLISFVTKSFDFGSFQNNWWGQGLVFLKWSTSCNSKFVKRFTKKRFWFLRGLNSSWKSRFITQDSQKFKLCWKLYNVNIRLFCYYDFFILCHVAEIWPKTSNSAQKWELRKLRSDDFFWKMMTIGDYLTTET